jgi:enediyne biosynthesis protein E4
MIAAALVAAVGLAPYSFVDRTVELGLSISGEGACWVDVDADGWTDLAAGGAVWRNEEGKRFAKLQEVGKVVAADFDNDGYPDLFSMSPLQLWRNGGGKRFEAFPLPPNLPETVSRGACWGDFDNDGFADLYVGGYENWQDQVTFPTLFLRNEGGKAFRLMWHEAQFRTRGVTACDFDQDGDLDIYASNYRLKPNLLRVNDGAGTFRNRAAEFNAAATSVGFPGGHSIGAAWGDFDADGLFDLFAGNFAHVDQRGDQPKSRFLRNRGPNFGHAFEDMGTCGVFYQESYASPAAGDFDNDGDLDLFFTTVYSVASFKKPNHPVLFRNDARFQFGDATADAGLGSLPPTYQAAWADFDRDGDLDLVTAGKLFVNQGGSRSWLQVRLFGGGAKVDRSAIGAQVRIRLGAKTLVRQVEAGTGEGNQNDFVLHFGLGGHQGRLDLEVQWPDGHKQKVSVKGPNRRVDVRR